MTTQNTFKPGLYTARGGAPVEIFAEREGKLFGRFYDNAASWELDGRFYSKKGETVLDLVAVHPLDKLIADLRDSIDGGEELRGRDQQISEWLRMAEQAREATS